MGFSLLYAAPEVIQACFRENRKEIRVTTALDAWSMGVIAVELFSGRAPLKAFEGQEKVRLYAWTDWPAALRKV